MAVQKLFPTAKVTIGPWIDSGFYYDFDMEPLTDKDLKRIKKEMVCKGRFCLLLVRGLFKLAKHSLAYCFRVRNSFLTSSVGSHCKPKFTVNKGRSFKR